MYLLHFIICRQFNVILITYLCFIAESFLYFFSFIYNLYVAIQSTNAVDFTLYKIESLVLLLLLLLLLCWDKTRNNASIHPPFNHPSVHPPVHV